MGKCIACGNVVATQEMLDGLCKECYDPAKALLQKSEPKSREMDKIVLEKNGKEVAVAYKKMDWFVFIVGALLGMFGSLGVLRYKDWRGFLILTGVSLAVFAAWIVLGEYWEHSLLIDLAFAILFWMAVASWYPSLRVKNLLAAGYRPKDENSRRILQSMGFIKEKTP